MRSTQALVDSTPAPVDPEPGQRTLLGRCARVVVAGLVLWSAAVESTAAEPARTGRIIGTVVDGETGSPMVGAFVRLQGHPLGGSTDLEGAYRVENVPPGTYTLESSMIGFATVTVTDVVVEAGETFKLDVALESEALELSREVVVTATALENTEAALLKTRQKAPAVSDAISAEDISRAGSGDAADAMKHVTGATVVGGKYVYVRGLGDRYSNVQLNGSSIPSADPDRRAVPMDLFPSGMLENIVTTKSFTPDKPGDFTGGSVNLGTRSLPERLNVTVSTSTSYNTQTSLNDRFLTYDGGRRDWLGADDGTRAVPDEVAAVDRAVLARLKADSTPAGTPEAAILDTTSKAFTGTMAPRETRAPLNHSNSVAVENRVDLFGKPLGFLGSLSYGRSYSMYDDGAQRVFKRSTATAPTLGIKQDLQDHKSTEEVQWGSLISASMQPHPNHELSGTYVYNRSTDDVSRSLLGCMEEVAGVPGREGCAEGLTPSRYFETASLQYTERAIQSFQLSGKHHLKELEDIRVEWRASTAEATQEEPDVRFFGFDYDPATGENYDIRPSGYTRPQRYFRDLTESNRQLGVDIDIPFTQWDGQRSKVRVGGSLLDVERHFSERTFQFDYLGFTGASFFGDLDDCTELFEDASGFFDGDAGAFFSTGNMGLIGTFERELGNQTRTFTCWGNAISDVTEDTNSYDGDQQVYAGYGMVELPLTRSLRAVAGARFESTRTDVASRKEDLEPGHLEEDDILPSVNAVYQIGEANVRAAYGRTLARPTMRELAPYESFDFMGGWITKGNPDLRRTLIDNYDLRWEWFPSPGEIYAASAFYKDFQDPIERTIINFNRLIEWTNVEDASVLGLELEARRQLGFLSPRWRNFWAGGNMSLIRSKVSIPDTELVAKLGKQVSEATPEELAAIDTERSFQGQSPYVVNLDVTYDSFERGLSAGLYYNIFGRRLSSVSFGQTPDVFEEARSELDFTLSKSFWRLYSVKLSAKNLLDSEVRLVYPLGDTDYVGSRYRKGRSFGLSVKYRAG